ncbi:MAG: 4-hydroxy-tetrahydrodipicolinate synthase [Janthinobacterium lividum]
MSTATAARPPRPFGSVLSAMVTPFTTSGGLDIDAAVALATRLVDEDGHDGLVLSGTTGESPTTSDEEKDRLLRAVLDAVGDRASVLAGVGTFDTAHTVELARAAEKAGAHGLLVVTPYYSKPPQSALLHHFSTIADATGLPVMLYDIPGRSGVAIETETLVRVAEHERIVAVKDAKGDLLATSWVLARTELAYYSGEDALNFALLAHGASGVVSVVGHVAGRDYAQMVAAVDAGDLVTARAVHTRLLPAVRGIMTRTQGVVAVKAALQLTGALGRRSVRAPLLEATPDEVATIAADLALAGLLPGDARCIPEDPRTTQSSARPNHHTVAAAQAAEGAA